LRKQSLKKDRYIFDSSAFLTLFEKEEGMETIRDLLFKSLKGQVEIFASFVSYTEIYYTTYQIEGELLALQRFNMITKLKITRVDSSVELSLLAGKLKAIHKLSFADAWIAATAFELDAILVHKDPEFLELKEQIRMLELPYK
jgi:predicted nucleic acid-binding protein